jgi:hypothetical protein
MTLRHKEDVGVNLSASPVTGGPLRGIAEVQRDLAAGRRLPPVERWNPPHCGAIDMIIKRNGDWHYMGTPIGRAAMVRLFSTILRREPDGSFVLVTPVERVSITVEDAPFIAVRADAEGEGEAQNLIFLTNLGDTVTAGPDRPIRVETDPGSGEPSPYVLVRGGLEAKLARTVFYEIVDLAVERAGEIGVWSGGAFFPIGRAA